MYYFIITIIDAGNNEWAVGDTKLNLAIEDYYKFIHRLQMVKELIPDIVKVYIYFTHEDEPRKEKLFQFMMSKVPYDFLYLKWSNDAYNCYNK